MQTEEGSGKIELGEISPFGSRTADQAQMCSTPKKTDRTLCKNEQRQNSFSSLGENQNPNTIPAAKTQRVEPH
jgi:hypothetical protein